MEEEIISKLKEEGFCFNQSKEYLVKRAIELSLQQGRTQQKIEDIEEILKLMQEIIEKEKLRCDYANAVTCWGMLEEELKSQLSNIQKDIKLDESQAPKILENGIPSKVLGDVSGCPSDKLKAGDGK